MSKPATNKAVDWKKPTYPNYPRLTEIANATDYELLTWSRFLPSPLNDEQRTIMNDIITQLKQRSNANNVKK